LPENFFEILGVDLVEKIYSKKKSPQPGNIYAAEGGKIFLRF